MEIQEHMMKLLLAFSFAIYYIIKPFNTLLADYLFTGLIISLPIAFAFILYRKFKGAKYFLISFWFIYIIGTWLFIIINIISIFQLILIITIGSISLIIFFLLKKEGISIPQFLLKSKIKEIEKFNEIENEIFSNIKILSDIQCKTLLILLDNPERIYSKKEIQKITKATHPRSLREINELEKLGLVEIIKIPRKAKGAPIFHGVKLSKNIINEKEKIKNLIKKRLEELEKSIS